MKTARHDIDGCMDEWMNEPMAGSIPPFYHVSLQHFYHDGNFAHSYDRSNRNAVSSTRLEWPTTKPIENCHITFQHYGNSQ
jgi:hypothetical protein